MSIGQLPSFVPPPGHRLVVLGAYGGMGRALVRAARALGLTVMALDTQRAIESSPPLEGVETLACDVSQESDVQRAFAHIAAAWGRIDALVNLVGYTGERVVVADMPTREWDDIVNTDLRGMFLVARAAAPLLQASAAQGHAPAAVLVSSTFGVAVPLPGYAPYATSKAGVINLVRALATEWAPTVRVNGLAPGVIETPFLKGGTGRPAKTTGLDLARFLETVPLKRTGQPDEIAAPLLYMLSPAASYLNGQTIHVNGGSHML